MSENRAFKLGLTSGSDCDKAHRSHMEYLRCNYKPVPAQDYIDQLKRCIKIQFKTKNFFVIIRL